MSDLKDLKSDTTISKKDRFINLDLFILAIVFIGIALFFLKDAYDSHIEDEHAIQEANEIGEYQYDRKVLFISSYAPTYASLPEQEMRYL